MMYYVYVAVLLIINFYVCWRLLVLEKYLKDHNGEIPRPTFKWPWEK